MSFILGALTAIGVMAFLRHRNSPWGWGPGPRGHHHHRRGPGRRGRAWQDRSVDRLLRWLDADREQSRVIREEVDAVFDHGRDLRGGMRDLRGAFAEGLRGERFDEAAMAETLGRQEASVKELRERVVAGVKRVREVLDEEQREALAELLERGPGGCGRARHAA